MLGRGSSVGRPQARGGVCGWHRNGAGLTCVVTPRQEAPSASAGCTGRTETVPDWFAGCGMLGAGDFATGCPVGRLGVAREAQRFPASARATPGSSRSGGVSIWRMLPRQPSDTSGCRFGCLSLQRPRRRCRREADSRLLRVPPPAPHDREASASGGCCPGSQATPPAVASAASACNGHDGVAGVKPASRLLRVPSPAPHDREACGSTEGVAFRREAPIAIAGHSGQRTARW